MSNNRATLTRKYEVEQSQPHRRIMKPKAPLFVIRNVLNDIRLKHYSNIITPHKTREGFWEKECAQYSTKSTCMLYEV